MAKPENRPSGIAAPQSQDDQATEGPASDGPTNEAVVPSEALKRKFRARRDRQSKNAAATPRESAEFAPLEMKMPAVLLTDAEEARCHLKIGQSMPDFRLTDLEGQEQSLHGLLGNKLTVVVFWSSSRPYSLQELGDLGPDVADNFADQGVEVVAIAEHEPMRAAGQAAERVGADFPVLIDAEGTCLQQCATGALPLTYLLDATGKVLWFDIEYSRSTRRDLQQALRFALHDLRTAGR